MAEGDRPGAMRRNRSEFDFIEAPLAATAANDGARDEEPRLHFHFGDSRLKVIGVSISECRFCGRDGKLEHASATIMLTKD